MPGRTSQRANARHNKRVTEKKPSGRYTAPIPREVRHSPRWFPWMILTVLGASVLVIVLNYLDVLPGAPSDWYTLGAILGILAGVFAATFYR